MAPPVVNRSKPQAGGAEGAGGAIAMTSRSRPGASDMWHLSRTESEPPAGDDWGATPVPRPTAWNLWLDCVPQTEIAEKIGVDPATVSRWVCKREQSSEIQTPPGKTDIAERIRVPQNHQ